MLSEAVMGATAVALSVVGFFLIDNWNMVEGAVLEGVAFGVAFANLRRSRVGKRNTARTILSWVSILFVAGCICFIGAIGLGIVD